MNHDTFQQVEELFHAALEHEPPERNVFLDRIAREYSPDVSAMVHRLLSKDGSETRWTDLGMTDGAPLPPPEQEPPGMLIGRFRLGRRLGYGGHGEVYHAEQVEPVRRTVALKMVRVGADSEAAVARFRSEQQSLALMSHPNIAAVYEAGLADAGRLYFAMAYVEGEPIDAFCDERTMTVRQRLELFLKVCRAVQHAHLKGLIHRDIKPSNILVAKRDGVAEPVLIDFGIAMATASTDTPDDRDGETHIALGTPAFMSPEQAGPPPQDLDTRSDIYALGILLCELLTGRTPLDVLRAPDASLAEIRRCIVEATAPAPIAILESDESVTAAAAATRQCTPAQLRRQVRGDLDAVVTRATARERVDRYQSVEVFAADIENVLHHRPVSVRSVTPVTRAARFARRHRAAVAVAGIVVATLLIGVIGTSLGMLRAASAARESDAVSAFLQEMLTSSPALEKGKTVKFVDVLANGAAMADEQFEDYPRRAAEVHFMLGETYMNLNVHADAQRELEKALELLRSAAGMDDPATLRAAYTLAALLAARLKLDEAEALAEEVATHATDRPGPLRGAYLASQRVFCEVMVRRGAYVEVEARVRELIPQIDAELGVESTEAYNARLILAKAMGRRVVGLGFIPEANAVRRDRIELLEEMAAIQERRFDGEDALTVLITDVLLAQSYFDLREYEAAERIVETLRPRIEERLGPTHGLYIAVLTTQAGLLYVRGRYDDAVDVKFEALDASLRALQSPRHPSVLGQVRDTLPYLDATDRVEEGLEMAREMYDTFAAMMGEDSVIARDARVWVARFCDRTGRVDEAKTHFAAIDAPAADPTHEGTAGYIPLFHAGHLARRGKFDEAETKLLVLVEAVGGVTTGMSSTAHPDDLARMFIEVYELWGRDDKVREYEAVIAEMRPIR